jgi:DNA-binding NarL/FixJ family response regulator
MRVGQKNKLTYRWARKGSRPRAAHDQRTQSTYLFGLVSILSRLDHLDFAGKTRIISHFPDAAERWIEAHANCEMLIYNVGGASIADHDNSQRIKALRAIAPDVPVVIFSKSESREEIISALNIGAQGRRFENRKTRS